MKVPSVDQRLLEVKEARDKAQECIRHAQRLMAERGKTKFTLIPQTATRRVDDWL